MWVAGVILRLVSIPFKALDRLLGGDKGRAAQPGSEGRPWNPLGMGTQGLFGWTANRARPIFRTFVVRNGYAGAARGQQADRPGPGAADDPSHARPAPAGEGPTIDLEQDESGRWK
jgi:hypothetical protein